MVVGRLGLTNSPRHGIVKALAIASLLFAPGSVATESPAPCYELSPEAAFDRGIELHKAGRQDEAKICFTLALDGFQGRAQSPPSRWPLGDYYTPEQLDRFFGPKQVVPE